MKRIVWILIFLSWTLFSIAQEQYDIKIAEGSIHVECYGEGQPILIINGGPGMNSQGFRYLASKMANSNRAIIYDQRGTGLSQIEVVDATTITMDAMVEDIEVIRKHLKIKEWVVLGHSFGGMLASYYATKFPEAIKGLILSSSGGINLDLFSSIDVNSKLTSLQRDSLSYWTNQISNGDTTYFARLQRGKYLAPAYLYDQSNVDIIAHRLTQGNWTINSLVFQDMRKINFDCEPGLKTFQQPILIIQGTDDILDLSLSEYAHSVFPKSSLEILNECGHYGWLDQPEKYFRSITNFLNRLG